MPMPRSFGSAHVTSRPAISMLPSLTSMSPAMLCSSVDLPQPEGPSSTRNSPLCTSSASWLMMSTPESRMPRFSIVTFDMRDLGSTLHGTGRDAAHEPAAGDQIDGQRQQRREEGRRHVPVVEPLAGGGVDDVVELYRHRQILAPREDEADQEVVPDVGHLHDGRD